MASKTTTSLMAIGPDANCPAAAGDPKADWLEHLAPVRVTINSRPSSQAWGKSLLSAVEGRHGNQCALGRLAGPMHSKRNRLGRRRVADAVQIGDLIRVKPGIDHWELGQVPDVQGALVSMSPSNGQILALVGGYDFR